MNGARRAVERSVPLTRWPTGQVVAAAAIAIACSGIVRWSVVADGAPVTGPGVLSAVRLLVGALAFWAIGRACMGTALRWSSGMRHPPAIHGLPVQLCAVAVGQVVAVLWIALRSGISEAAERLLGTGLPIGRVEVIAILVCCIAALALDFQPLRAQDARETRRRAIGSLIALFAALCLVCMAVGLREMPRVSALSSDPDSHAYWARMVMRLGVIPWDQGVLGTGSFGYPGGFAALNASWCALSGVSVIDAATIQPVLQSLLACLVFAALAPACLSSSDIDKASPTSWPAVLLITVILMLVYWFAMPYGLQRDRYFGEGTARLSLMTFTALVVMGWLSPLKVKLTDRERALRLVTMAGSVGAIALVNPIAALVPAVPFFAVALDEVRRFLLRRKLRVTGALPVVALAAVLLLGGATLLSDPYYGERVVPRRSVGPIAAITQSPSDLPVQEADSILKPPDQSILSLMSPGQALAHSQAGIGTSGSMQLAWALALCGAVAVWFRRSPARALRWLAMLFLLGIVHYAALWVSPAATGELPLHLVQPYLIDSANQMGIVLAFCGLAVGVAYIASLERAWSRTMVLTTTATLAWIPQTSNAAANPSLLMRPRITRLDGSMGVPTPADLEVIRLWNSHAAELVASKPDMTYADAPKILLVGRPADLGSERWVFPVGGTRLLPLESPLPSAFFYGNGSEDWSYENYLNRICRQFDEQWLRERNVRYIFVPEDTRGCLAISEQELLRRCRPVCESGRSRIYEFQWEAPPR